MHPTEIILVANTDPPHLDSVCVFPTRKEEKSLNLKDNKHVWLAAAEFNRHYNRCQLSSAPQTLLAVNKQARLTSEAFHTQAEVLFLSPDSALRRYSPKDFYTFFSFTLEKGRWFI